jgi:hypothetical protein
VSYNFGLVPAARGRVRRRCSGSLAAGAARLPRPFYRLPSTTREAAMHPDATLTGVMPICVTAWCEWSRGGSGPTGDPAGGSLRYSSSQCPLRHQNARRRTSQRWRPRQRAELTENPRRDRVVWKLEYCSDDVASCLLLLVFNCCCKWPKWWAAEVQREKPCTALTVLTLV